MNFNAHLHIHIDLNGKEEATPTTMTTIAKTAKELVLSRKLIERSMQFHKNIDICLCLVPSIPHLDICTEGS